MSEIKSSILRISSNQRNKSAYENTSNFSVNFSNNGAVQKIHSVVLKHFSFTNTFYNINQYNNVLEVKDDVGDTQTITVPIGNYNIRELYTYINADHKMPSNNVFSYDSITNKLTLTASASHPIQILGSGTINKVLGYKEGDSVVYAADTEAPFQVALQGNQHIFIKSTALSNQSNLIEAGENQEEPVFAMIPNDVPFGAIKHYETVHDTLDVVNYHSQDGISLSNIDITIVDNHKRELDTSCHEVNMILKVFYE